MLINAQGHEELRIALVAGSTLESYQVEVGESGLSRGNIYRGVVSGVQPALNAAFIDFGAERNGFLAIQDVVREAYVREPEGGGRPEIDEVLLKSKPVVVQVTRDPEGSKGAALTTNLSLAGRYLVLTPFDDHRGVSRKVEDEEIRRDLRDLAGKPELPDGCGVIVAPTRRPTKTEINRDARRWSRCGSASRPRPRRATVRSCSTATRT
jgi:ribonuclease E